MRDQIREVIVTAAEAAGLSADRVISLVKKDNLTLKRPRMELQFLPEKLTRSGRKLGVWRTKTEQIRKRELYESEMDVAANVLAEEEAWLSDFCYRFIASLPRGFNDRRDNWVKARAQKAAFGKAADNRVGDGVIEVFKKANQLLILTFTWRITSEEAEKLIQTFSLDMKFK